MDNLKSAIRSSASGPVRKTEAGTYIQPYCFGPDFIGFSGHFPEYPVLPALVQVLTVLSMAEGIKGHRLSILSLEKAKFHIELFPGREIAVQYREVFIKGKRSLEATLTVAEGLAASFMLTIDEG